MSDSAKKKVFTEEHKANLKIALKGRKMPPLSEDRRIQLRAIHKGRICTEEQKARMSEAKRKSWAEKRQN